MPTNVPPPTFGPTGFIAPSEEDVLAGVLADFQAAFGGGLNPALSTPQGQLASSTAAIIGEANDTFVYLTNQLNPSFAVGRWQDALGAIYFLQRLPSEPTVLQLLCTGLTGLTIPVDALVTDAAGNLYGCTGSGPITGAGNVTLSFAALVPGPTAVPAVDGVEIYQQIGGWDGVSCTSGVVGQSTESRQAFEARRAASVAANSIGAVSSIRGAVLAVSGVLDAYVTENPDVAPVTINGFLLAAHSVYVAAIGGTDADVARAIWSKKAPGCAYNGNTTVVVQDTRSGYSPPYPSYNVTFERPPSLAIFFSVVIVNSAQVPADAVAQIQNALLSAFAGGDGGPRAAIGASLYATRYVAPISALGAWAQVASIGMGSANSPAATFTGSIVGSVLTVSAVASGALHVGDVLVSGSAVTGTGVIAPGQSITSLGTGSGGTGTYNLALSQGVPSGAMRAITVNGSSVIVQINQSPTLAAADIAVDTT